MMSLVMLLLVSVIAVPAQALETAVVTRHQTDQYLRFDGVVEAVERSTVTAQTTGRVMQLPFDVGDAVPAGAQIVQLTSEEQAARVDAARSAVAEAQARQREADQAYVRAQEIRAEKLISQAEFDQVAANQRAATARLNASEAQLRQAREALKYTVVTAPYGGIVETRHVQIGESVVPGTPLMTGLSLERLRVVADVPQQATAALRAYGRVEVITPEGIHVTPENLVIPPSADPATHSFRVRLDLPQGDHGLLPGMLVKLSFVDGQRERMLIPAAAVVRRGELTGAYVLGGDGSVQLRYLRLGSPSYPEGEPVEAGLQIGERVVLDTVEAARLYKAQQP